MSDASGMAAGAAAGVRDLVSSRFNESQDYATQAWASAQAALNDLVNLVMHPAFSGSVDVPFNYTGEDIVVSSHGEKPETPDIDSTFDFVKPVLGTLKELPAFSYLTDTIDEAREAFIAKILAILEDGATGLDADVEAQIWARARSRQELENLRQYDEAENYYAARGYTLPPGALSGRLQEIAIEIVRNNSYLNNDITVEQARLAQTNSHFVIEKGATMVLEMMKTSLSSVLEYNKGTIEVFVADAERYKQEIQTKLATIEGVVKIFVAEAEVYKAKAEVDNTDISAQVEINKLKLDEAKTQSTIDLKEIELELDAATKVFQLQVEAIKAGSQILSQIAASALSGVNATASYGFAGGADVKETASWDYNWDKTKELETTHNQHIWQET